MTTLAEQRREHLSDPVKIDRVQQASWEVMWWEKKTRKHNTRSNRVQRDAAKAKLKRLMEATPV